MRRALVTAALFVVALATCARTARARDPERAAELFREGRDALNAGDNETACRKFSESEGLDPRVGTLINLALCEEGRRKLAAAHQYWQQATDFARATSDARADYCAEQLARTEQRVPRLTIRLDGAAPPDTTVTRDGIDFGASLGVPLPVELGPHKIAARAWGYAPREVEVEVPEGESLEVVVAPGPPVASGAPGQGGAAREPAPRGASALRPVAYFAAGLGVVGLGVGTAFGVRALTAGSDASRHCDGDVCDSAGASARSDEQTAGNAATVGLVSGALLLTAGAAVYALTPPPGEARHVQRDLAYVLGAAGLVAGGVGALFGVRAIDAMRTSSSGCSGDVCDHAAAAARRDAIGQGNVSTIALVTSGGLLAGGLTLWLTAPRGPSLTVAPSATGGGASIRLVSTW
jgi:hypothetical protein